MAAKDAERRHQTVFEHAFRFQALLKPDGEILEIDRQALAFWGLDESAVRGRRFWEIGWRLVQDEQAQRLRSAIEAAAQGQMVRREAAVWDLRHRPASLSFSLRPLRDAAGEVVVLVVDARNLARPAQAPAAPLPGASRARAVLAALPEPLLLLDEAGRIEYVSPSAAAHLGRASEALLGRGLLAAGGLPEESAELSLDPVAPGLGMRARCTPLPAAEGGGMLLTLREGLSAGAEGLPDPVTGLLNRGGLMLQLERLLLEGGAHTLCYLDLDAFQQLRERHGRERADEVLRQVAAELREHARHGDLLARVGPDAFGLLLRDCGLDNARTVAEALLSSIHELGPATEAGRAGRLNASIGMATPAADVRTWLRDARQACLEAKEAGGNTVMTFHRGRSRRRARQTFQSLLDQGEVRLYQQPVVGIRDGGRPAHSEILLRWLDDEGSLQPALSLLRHAAHAGLLAQLDRWVIASVFRLAAERRESYSINLGTASLSDGGLVSFLGEQRAQHELDPALISFEIPESALLADPAAIRARMDELSGQGYALTLDDCTASTGLLRTLPLDYLKIGGGLTRHLLNDPMDQLMVDSLNRLAHLGGRRTIAKNVENDATMRCLESLGLDYAQGHAVASPVELAPLTVH